MRHIKIYLVQTNVEVVVNSVTIYYYIKPRRSI